MSAADANRTFSQLLRAVREGNTYIVTSHGEAVARIVPAHRDEGMARRAKEVLLARLEKEPVVDAGRWSRDELYDDDA